MAERISQDNFDTKILQAEGVAVADFYSDSCVPCKRISPLLADLEEAHDNVYVGKVNIAYDRKIPGGIYTDAYLFQKWSRSETATRCSEKSRAGRSSCRSC